MYTDHPDLSDAAVEHISQMLTLAKSKHQEAMALLGTPVQNALPRLQEVLRLLDEVELLADDAATYVDADVMKAAINNLHVQQGCCQSNANRSPLNKGRTGDCCVSGSKRLPLS